MGDDDNLQPPTSGLTAGYPAWQLSRSLLTRDTHPDAGTRKRAEKRVADWARVINGMMQGTLSIGSRTPVQNTPSWVTLNVMTGGFATGTFAAGGELQPHERQLAQTLSIPVDERTRQRLNTYYLTDSGLARLQAMLSSGCYLVNVPEEAALLVVAWLVEHNQAVAARALLDEIMPFFDRLRFYPIPTEAPHARDGRVYLQSVAETRHRLEAMTPNSRVLAQREAIEIWAPLYDRFIRLLVETVDGDLPVLSTDQKGSRVGVGGRPLQRIDQAWRNRASALLNEYTELRQKHRLCSKPDRPNENFCKLRFVLQTLTTESRDPEEREIKCARNILAAALHRHGPPTSEEAQAMRARQRAQNRPPLHHDLMKIVVDRLRDEPAHLGLADVTRALRATDQDEVVDDRIPVGTEIPSSIQRRVRRATMATPAQLVESGIIRSGDTLATVLPQVSAKFYSADIIHDDLRQLDAAVYEAFRRRRSLLLLNLESQVRLRELPWTQSYVSYREAQDASKSAARTTFQEYAQLTLHAFPEAIVPNKLLQEFRSLAAAADLNVPLVDEVAADIFMGTFSAKFVEAAQLAAEVFAGTLYERYYAIDVDEIRSLPKPRSRGRNKAGDRLAAVCVRRSGGQSGRWNVAANGKVIEQVQVLTTQNLAALVSALELQGWMKETASDLARRSLSWIVKRLQISPSHRHARLIALKNSAYAWRQMVFYLSQAQEADVFEFLNWGDDLLARQPRSFTDRFRLAWLGLQSAATGDRIETESPGVPFYGWSTGGHWLDN